MGSCFDSSLAETFLLKSLRKVRNKVWIATPVGTADQLTCRYYDPYLVDAVNALIGAQSGAEPLSTYTVVFRGHTPSKSDYEYDESSGYKVIKCNHMDWEGGYSALEDVKKAWGVSCEGIKLENGDILVSCIGSGSIGKVVRWVPENEDDIVIPVSEITVCRPKNIEDSVFLELFLQSSYGLRQLLRYETGGTGQTHLYPEQIKLVLIPKKEDEKWKLFVSKAINALTDYRNYKQGNFSHTAKIRALANKINDDLMELMDDKFCYSVDQEIEDALR
jgi:hypothetical protein